MTRLTGTDAINAAKNNPEIVLHKYNDPIEDAREVTFEEAKEIAREDANLIWCEVEEAPCEKDA